MAMKEPSNPYVPNMDSMDELLSEFAINLEELSLKYPGLAAIDFENIISITIHNLLCVGSDKGGIYGDVITYAFGVEEQRSKYLHE